MTLDAFWTTNQKDMEQFIQMSHNAAAHVDYIQGGGGNTSVKLADGLMAIKASGFSMGQISRDNAYAVLDGAVLRTFYGETDPATLDDIEASGSKVAKDATLAIDGLPSLRPSVEAGFHSILDKYVLHTHSVYANLASCSKDGRDCLAEALAGAPYAFGFVPYVDPGARLTFQIAGVCDEVEATMGKRPALLLMENHGIIAHADTAEEATRIHEDANQRIAAYFGVTTADFPTIAIRPDGENWRSDTPWLAQRLAGGAHDAAFFTAESLYPDQLVFLGGNLSDAASEAEVSAATTSGVIVHDTGAVQYRCAESEALVMEQTLCCVLFVIEKIRAKGKQVQAMDAAGKDFIANWESEKYRKSLVQK